jgi:hypothetical protein
MPSSTVRFARVAGAALLPLAVLGVVVSLGCYAPRSSQGGRPLQSGNATLSSPSGRPAFGGSRWHPVEVASARFRVLMPIRAEVKTERQRAEDGTPMRIHSAQIEDGRMMLSFVVTDIDRGLVGDPVDLLNGMTRRFLAEVNRFNVISSNEITHQGLIGMEMRSREPEEGLELFTRHLVGRRRTFTLIAAVRASSVRGAEAMVDYYLRSLTVSPDEAIVPQGTGAMGSAWAYVTPARDDFSVRLPGAPRVSDVTLELDGESIDGREYRVAVADGSVSFVARVYRFERSMPSRLLEKVEALAVGSGRSVRERSDVQRQGYAGSRIVFARGDAAEHATYFQTMSRLYEFTMTNPTSREEELAAARRAFYRSIRIH